MTKKSFRLVLAICGVTAAVGIAAYAYTSGMAELDRRAQLESVPPSVEFILEKDEYRLDDSITIVMKNVGNHTLHTPSIPVGFSIYVQDKNRVCNWIGLADEVGLFPPGSNVTVVWEQHTDRCAQARQPGTYELRADHFYSFDRSEMPVLEITILPDN